MIMENSIQNLIIMEIPYYEQCLQIIKNKETIKFNFKDCYIELDENNNKRLVCSEDFEIPSKIIDDILSIQFYNGEIEKIVNDNSIKKITYDILNVLDKKYDYNILDNINSVDTLKNLQQEIILDYDSKDDFSQKIKDILDNKINYNNIQKKIKTCKDTLFKCFESYIISISDLYELDDTYDQYQHFKYACFVVKAVLDFQVVHKELNIILDNFKYKKTEQSVPSIWDYFGMNSGETSLNK